MYLLARVIAYIYQSFSWPMDGDLSFLYYISWLMNDHDFVPYRDVHETSFFGTFIFYSVLTRIAGYSTIAFHIVDALFFLTLSFLTIRLLKPFGMLSGWLAVGLFGELYYQAGIGVHLQRDIVALLPAVLGLLLAQEEHMSTTGRSLLIGALFAMAACIKPQFALGIFPVATLMYFQNKQSMTVRQMQVAMAYCLAGFLLIVMLGLLWLITHGVLSSFLDMTFNYLPAYNSINGRNFARMPADALIGAIKWLGGTILMSGLILLPSIFHLFYKAKVTCHAKSLAICVVVLWVLYLLYVTFAGKYWGYHIMPSNYFCALGMSFIAAKPAMEIQYARKYLFITGVWLFLCWYAILQQTLFICPTVNTELNQRTERAISTLTDFLQERLKPGDKVLPHVLHTRGAIFPALLKAKAIPATPYLENYLLYHNVSSPYVRRARQRFLAMLQTAPPRFIITTPTVFYFHGQDTEATFHPFEAWLQQNYSLVLSSPDLPNQSATEAFEVYEYSPRERRVAK